VFLVTLLMGMISLALGLFRLGFVVNFISRPVLAGFASASAIITIVSMLKVGESGGCQREWRGGALRRLCSGVMILWCSRFVP
jgi:hypothetical protein